MRKVVNEKTLELNVCAELLEAIRTTFPKAFWYGLTGGQEKILPVDEFIRMNGRLSYFQFKSPNRQRRADGCSVFQLSTRQFDNLRQLSAGRPGATFYALPDLTELKKLRRLSPNLRLMTCFVDIEDMAVFAPHVMGTKSFRVGLDCNSSTITLAMEPRITAPCLGIQPLIGRLADAHPVELRRADNQTEILAETEILVEGLAHLRRPAVLSY